MKFGIQTLFLILASFTTIAVHASESDIISLIQRNDISATEKLLGDVQRRFENGSLTEIDLRNTFRPFYKLDPESFKNLNNWATNSPRSYAAHLALGIYYKKLALTIRGGKYISETPQENIDEMTRYLEKSNNELRHSLTLTPKPYLSIFHLLDISAHFGNREDSKKLLSEANKVLPNNVLARGRYAISLLPRWGGSYAELDSFIASSRKQGVPPNIISLLESIKQDDIGHTLEEHGDHTAALEHFEKALQLGAKAGGTLGVDFLPVSRYYICLGPNVATYCQ
jgi:tetratricopeptide (TPR) repeat protein